jgi:hypothetical protein
MCAHARACDCECDCMCVCVCVCVCRQQAACWQGGVHACAARADVSAPIDKVKSAAAVVGRRRLGATLPEGGGGHAQTGVCVCVCSGQLRMCHMQTPPRASMLPCAA